MWPYTKDKGNCSDASVNLYTGQKCPFAAIDKSKSLLKEMWMQLDYLVLSNLNLSVICEMHGRSLPASQLAGKLQQLP